MRNYHDFNVDLGCSDIASITIRFASVGEIGNESFENTSKVIYFEEDGDYSAHLIKDVEPPSHYSLIMKGNGWIKIYDDKSLVTELNAKKIEFYRAGKRGCLIRLINNI